MSRASVLVVDDEESFHTGIATYLKRYRVIQAFSGWQAREALQRHHVDVVLLDLGLPDTDGLKLLDMIREERSDLEVIVITAHSEIENAVKAVKRGAFDFLAKTYENYRRLSDHVERALDNRRRRRERIEAQSRLRWLSDAFGLMENSDAPDMQRIVGLARQVAATPLTVLLEGESGVGKEVMARYIHCNSDRADKPFVAINLAASPKTLLESHLFGHVKGAFTGATTAKPGKFELADGGTLFLDEIGELDLNAQVKLLRVLQEREVERLGAPEPAPVDVRVIAATNKELVAEVAEGRFREDLFWRLNVLLVQIPPLRRRLEDIEGLTKLLALKHSAILGRAVPQFLPDAMTVMRQYDWPGNIRELENLVMRLVALNPGKGISAGDIPPEYCLRALNHLAEQAAQQGSRNGKDKRLYFLAREQFERYLVRLMVNRYQGDRKAAAAALGVSFTTVKEKMRGEWGDFTWNL
jgi:DNA-binding NtrC family response regulator